MPPVRHTVGMTAKPMKTERTHEENQERAYIAASRRSDRSLEARIESARRASEIHKKRTGRALRVTEQDVVNEEMYEEEDEDLPAQYRRLTAHLNTGSADFNRRFHAYIQSQAGIRMAASGAVPAYNFAPGMPQQQFVNPQNFAHAPPFMYSMPQQMMQQQTTPGPYNGSPYPKPQGAQIRQMQHNRSASIAAPTQDNNSFQSPVFPLESTGFDVRRMSLPVHKAQRPGLSRNSSSVHTLASVKKEPTDTPQGIVAKSSPSSQREDQSPAAATPGGVFYSVPTTPLNSEPPSQSQDFGSILTTSLPPESQMMLGNVLDRSDPLMSGSEYMSQMGFYSNDSLYPSKNFDQTSAGMSQTLTQSVPTLDTTVSGFHGLPSATSGLNDNFQFSPEDQLFGTIFDSSFASSLSRNNSIGDFTQGDFDAYLQPDVAYENNELFK